MSQHEGVGSREELTSGVDADAVLEIVPDGVSLFFIQAPAFGGSFFRSAG